MVHSAQKVNKRGLMDSRELRSPLVGTMLEDFPVLKSTVEILKSNYGIEVFVSDSGYVSLRSEITTLKGEDVAETVISQTQTLFPKLPEARKQTRACAEAYVQISGVPYNLALEVSVALENSIDFILTPNARDFNGLIPPECVVSMYDCLKILSNGGYQRFKPSLLVVDGGFKSLQTLREFMLGSTPPKNFNWEKVDELGLFDNLNKLRETSSFRKNPNNYNNKVDKHEGKKIVISSNSINFLLFLVVVYDTELDINTNLTNIKVCLFPETKNRNLPGMIKLEILDRYFTLITEVEPREALRNFCAKVQGSLGEEFYIRITLHGNVHTERYVIH